MGKLPLDKAYLTAIWLETLLYGARVQCLLWNATSSLWNLGINFTLCWICGYVLIKKKSKIPWIMLAVVIFQWMISTVHVSLGFTVRICSFHLSPLQHESSPLSKQRLIYGFIYDRNQPGGPAAYFSNISIPGNVAKVFLHTLNVSLPGPIGRPSGRSTWA